MMKLKTVLTCDQSESRFDEPQTLWIMSLNEFNHHFAEITAKNKGD
ncbi:hypothetical protein SRABI13_00003 [Erwinia aphidicola]|jgi:hypothetical protein|nr:hypothetical protein SRABI13_00003 [Erwinia aphidicola]